MLRVIGAVLTTFSAVLFLAVFFADLFGLHTNPYLGVVFFLVLPAVFLLGLALIPIGGWRGRSPRMDPYSHADTVCVYGLAPNTTLPPVQQLPPVVNELQRATAEIRYRLSPRFGAGFVYWYDKYTVNDFATNPQTLTSIAQPSLFTIGYLGLPYTANTFSGRFTYFW